MIVITSLQSQSLPLAIYNFNISSVCVASCHASFSWISSINFDFTMGLCAWNFTIAMEYMLSSSTKVTSSHLEQSIELSSQLESSVLSKSRQESHPPKHHYTQAKCKALPENDKGQSRWFENFEILKLLGTVSNIMDTIKMCSTDQTISLESYSFQTVWGALL